MTDLKITEGLASFDWDAYQTDRERIAINSRTYANTDIVEAFKKCYGIKLKKSNCGKANDVPQQIAIGQTITARIKSIGKGKNNVQFDCGNIKDDIVSATDLSRFARFKKNIPNHDIEMCVVGKNNKSYIVDCIQPLYSKFNDRIEKSISEQCNYRGEDRSVTIHDLRWTHGGFIGKIDVDEVCEFTGEETQLDVFIPGSQIVLNIERDFSKWAGATVQAFIMNFNRALLNNPSTPAIICSVKKYLEHKGNVNKIDLFKAYTENNDEWKKNLATVRSGVVTGVINTSKKCGVFVEIPDLNITGLVSLKPAQIVNYHPGDEVDVVITAFDEIRYYDKEYDQLRHVTPYVISPEGIVKECNLKPVLELVIEN